MTFCGSAVPIIVCAGRSCESVLVFCGSSVPATDETYWLPAELLNPRWSAGETTTGVKVLPNHVVLSAISATAGCRSAAASSCSCLSQRFTVDLDTTASWPGIFIDARAGRCEEAST